MSASLNIETTQKSLALARSVYQRSTRSISVFVFDLAWLIQLGLLIGCWLWIANDGLLEAWWDTSVSMSQLYLSPWQRLQFAMRDPRSVAIVIAIVLGTASSLAVISSLFFGGLHQRSILRWMLLTSVVGIWLFTAGQWRWLAWEAKARRVDRCIPAFDRLVQELERDWPKQEGERSSLGRFMAYPPTNPTILMLLGCPQLGATNLQIRAIERTLGEAMRFELSGSESGDWLEHRERLDTRPTTFAGGLGYTYQVGKSARLTDNWYLVRYY